METSRCGLHWPHLRSGQAENGGQTMQALLAPVQLTRSVTLNESPLPSAEAAAPGG